MRRPEFPPPSNRAPLSETLHRGDTQPQPDVRDRPGRYRQELLRRRARRAGTGGGPDRSNHSDSARGGGGEQLGFLPGDLEDKFSPYIDAFRDILNARLGAGTVDYCLRHGRIIASPLAYMRGKTFDAHTFVVLDEAQNTTPAQMKMFLTRIGEDSTVVVNGDIGQSDVRGPNGLADAIERLQEVPGVYVHEFERDDIVRSGLVRDIIDRYEPSGRL
jgi:hypothetical protein